MGRWYIENDRWNELDEDSIRCESRNYSDSLKLCAECRLIQNTCEIEKYSAKVCIETESSPSPVVEISPLEINGIRHYDVAYLLEFRINDRDDVGNIAIQKIIVRYDGFNWITESRTHVDGPLRMDNSRYYAFWCSRESINSKFNRVSNEWSISYVRPGCITIGLNGKDVGYSYCRDCNVFIDSIDCFVHVLRSARPITLRAIV